MFVTYEGKTLKGRQVKVEELICFEPHLKHSRDCITVKGESISVDGYKYDICRHTSGFPEGITQIKNGFNLREFCLLLKSFRTLPTPPLGPPPSVGDFLFQT